MNAVTRRELALNTLDWLTSRQGWVHASSTPVAVGDPGRFHALFGRDALITALQVLPDRPQIARRTLQALASRQGVRVDEETEEQPGRILHERWSKAPAWMEQAGWPVRGGSLTYFGSSDATSWFLVLLAATQDAELQHELRYARAAAARWLETALARGRGLIRCGPRRYGGGLSQQGWRDCLDPVTDEHGGGILTPGGTAPPAPMADADSQAAAIAALDALVVLDPDRATHWQRLANRLRSDVAAVFVPDVIAIDAHGTPVPGVSSALGWLLWARALAPEVAAMAAHRLTCPDLLTPYGLRTLSVQHPRFAPGAYHRGGVWPFDNWFAWGGLRDLGHPAADQVLDGVLAGVSGIGHFPELYAVTVDGRLAPVPVANRVQAWTVGAVLAFERGWDGRPG